MIITVHLNDINTIKPLCLWDVNLPAKVETNIPPKVKMVLHLLTLILTSANSKTF